MSSCCSNQTSRWTPYFFCEAGQRPFAMIVRTQDQIIGHAGVKRTVRTRCEHVREVDMVPNHEVMFAHDVQLVIPAAAESRKLLDRVD